MRDRTPMKTDAEKEIPIGNPSSNQGERNECKKFF